MMPYTRMQFDDVTQEERDAVFDAMLIYSELDTLAMLMIVEAWLEGGSLVMPVGSAFTLKLQANFLT